MRELIADLIGEMHNSNALPFQMTLEGENLFEFVLIGIVTLKELSWKRKPPLESGEKWSFTVF